MTEHPPDLLPEANATALGGVVTALLEGRWPDFVISAMEPADAAAALVSRGQVKQEEIDQECLSLLDRFHGSVLDAPTDVFNLQVLRLSQLLAIVQRLEPEKTVVDLHRRFMRWNGFFSNFVIDAALDLRREYWRLLAMTQELAAQTGIAPRRLMPMWLSICADCGGLYHESYLRVALIGLRRLPLGKEFSSNEAFALQGLTRWAVKRRPSKEIFMRQWRVLEGDFPRSPVYWQTHVEAVIAAAEHELREETGNNSATFPAAQWWRNDVDVGQIPTTLPKEPPAREQRERILHRIGLPVGQIKSEIMALVAGHKAYANVTGDVFYAVRTACNIGMRLLQNSAVDEQLERGQIAADLAQTAMDYQPGNEFAWSLYRDALAVQGRLLDAELVGWETIRRFPANEQWRTQLATVLAEQLDRPGEAVALLRETIALFPQNAYARTQLATVLADDLNDVQAARDVLLAAQKANAGGAVTVTLLAKLQQRHKLRGASKTQRPETESQPQQLDLPGAAARRELFLVENGLTTSSQSLEALRKLSRSDYVTFAINLIGNSESSDTTFSLAFERAARGGSAEALRALIRRANTGEKALVESAISVFEPAAENTNNQAPPPSVENDKVVVLARFIASAHGKPLAVMKTVFQAAAGALLDNGPVALAA